MEKSVRRVVSASARSLDKEPREPEPRITRIDRDLELVAPRGCHASVLLKLVNRDNRHRYYAWLAMVGRAGSEVSVMYRHTGADTIRCDLPFGVPLSAKSLERHLRQFLAAEVAGPPPVIIED